MCGQSTAYNTYATLVHTNPLFKGFSGYTNALKEIIISQENYNSKRSQTSELRFWGFSLPLNLDEMSRNVVKLIRFATKKSIPIFCMKKIFTIRTTEDVYGKAKL